MTATTNRIERIKLSEIADPPVNPNRLAEPRYDLLIEAMLRVGHAQPALARPKDGAYEIVDGVHRTKAVRAILAMDPHAIEDLERRRAVVDFQAAHTDGAVDCVVRDMTDEQARLVQIGMNKLRGELDLSAVADILAELEGMGVEHSELTLSGFTADEVADLISTTADFGEDIPPDVGGLPEEPKEEKVKPFVLELTFRTRDELAKAKRGLRKAAGGGKSPDLAKGLINLIDGS